MKTLKRTGIGHLCALLITGVIVRENIAQRGKEEKILVRSLKRPVNFKPQKWGHGWLDIMMDVAAAEKLIGKDKTKELMSAVDFDKEKIIHVRWGTGGPPFGVLKHEVVRTGEERKLNFFVQGPPSAGGRKWSLPTRSDFFAVPRNVVVSLEAKERK